jgi:hypothetical protein
MYHYLLSPRSSTLWICRSADFGHFLSPTQLMDQQDDSYHEAIERCVMLFLRIYLANRHVKMSIFIHKSEVLSEDYRGGELLLATALTTADSQKTMEKSNETRSTAWRITISTVFKHSPQMSISVVEKQQRCSTRQCTPRSNSS